MNFLKTLQQKLINSYDNLQDNFKNYFTTGIDSNAIYTYKNKSLACSKDFSDTFLNSKQKYHIAFKQYIHDKKTIQ